MFGPPLTPGKRLASAARGQAGIDRRLCFAPGLYAAGRRIHRTVQSAGVPEPGVVPDARDTHPTLYDTIAYAFIFARSKPGPWHSPLSRGTRRGALEGDVDIVRVRFKPVRQSQRDRK